MAKKKKDKDSKSKKSDSQSKVTADVSNLINTLELTDTNSIIPKLETHIKSEEELMEEMDSSQEGVKEFPSFLNTGKKESHTSTVLPSDQTAEVPVEELTDESTQESVTKTQENLEETQENIAETQENVEETQESQEKIDNLNILAPPPPPPPLPPTSPHSGDQQPPEVRKEKSEEKYVTTGNLFGDIGVFLEELTDSYKKRYDLWEESTNNILDALKALEKNDKQNSDILIESLQKFDEIILKGLDKFKVKRDFSAKYSDADYEEVNRVLKKTLTLLGLQLKEIKIKDLLNEITEIYSR